MLAFSLLGLLVGGCGRSGLLGNGGVTECPAGTLRDPQGNCIVIPDGGIDFAGFDALPPPPDFKNVDLFGRDLIVLPDMTTDMVLPCKQRPEICDNNIDDNCDNRVDCKDPQCMGHPHCTILGKEICNNGVDDNVNGLVDCKDPECFQFPACKPHMCDPINPDCNDPACVNDPKCQNLICKPTVDFGALAHNDAKSTRNINTVGTKDVAITPCAPGGGGMVVTQFDVLTDKTSVRLDFTQAMGADHVFALFRSGTNQKCEANPLGCFDPKSAPMGTTTWILDTGRYYLIVQPFTVTHQGKVDVTLTTPPIAKKEVCNNGVDDDGNNLIDCADPACINDMACITKTCNPDFVVGTLVLNDPPKVVDFDTTGRKSNQILGCAAGGGEDAVVQFSLKETLGVLMEWDQDGDHVIEMFRKPPAGQNCDYISMGCYLPSMGGPGQPQVAWGEWPPGDYLFIWQAIKPGNEGTVHVELSAYKNRKIELCHNGIDDDGNGLVDCSDPACFADPGCGAPVCMPDVNLGVLVLNAQPKSVTLDTKTGILNEEVSCAKGGGRAKIVQVELKENAGMGFQCTMSPMDSHVLGLFAEAGPRDSCDKTEIVCADPSIIPFGCGYEIPNLQPGIYYVIVQAFQAGKEGTVNLALSANEDRALEVCNNKIDDDADGFTDCADRKCATSPICFATACKPNITIDPLPTTGTPVFELIQTANRMDIVSMPCEVKPGGADQVIAITLPQQATITVTYNQLGQHTFALYPNIGSGLVCDAGKVLGCATTPTANSTGTVTLPNMPAGKYYLVIGADQPGDEGSVSLKITAMP